MRTIGRLTVAFTIAFVVAFATAAKATDSCNYTWYWDESYTFGFHWMLYFHTPAGDGPTDIYIDWGDGTTDEVSNSQINGTQGFFHVFPSTVPAYYTAVATLTPAGGDPCSMWIGVGFF